MPIITDPSYQAPTYFNNGHLQSIFPHLCRFIRGISYQRERIATPDDDFLDIDWSCVGSKRAIILSHGLEGSSRQPYILGMARAFNRQGWDAIAWNFRGCSGEPNQQVRAYHSGATDDLETIIQHVFNKRGYQEIALIGFSLGGNLTLKYVGERENSIDKRILSAITFSVPCQLKGSAYHLDRSENRIYLSRFMRQLKNKVKAKHKLYPEHINLTDLHKMKSFRAFDDCYTAPWHGFKNAEDYWENCSATQFIQGIRIPTLLINAKNDPFLPESCYPYQQALQSDYLHLETPNSGGHVGFISFNRSGTYWSEQRAVEFAENPLTVS